MNPSTDFSSLKAPFEQDLLNQWMKEWPLPPEEPTRVVVFCSGGVDSMVLLHLTHMLQLRVGFALSVVHFNFQLRGEESQADARRVQGFCEDKALPFTELVHPPPATTGIQAWARKVRREKQAELLNQGHWVFLGHHQDDLVENFFLRLARGVAPERGLGMNAREGRVCRPLLSVTKKEIFGYATRHKVPFGEDSSNAKLIYNRNRIRHEVLPVLKDINPRVVDKVIQFAKSCEALGEFVEHQVRKDMPSLPDRVELSVLAGLEPVAADAALALMFKHRLGDQFQCQQSLMRKIHTLTRCQEPVRFQLTEKFCLKDEGGFLDIEPVASMPSPRYHQHLASLNTRMYSVWVKPTDSTVILYKSRMWLTLSNRTHLPMNVELACMAGLSDEELVVSAGNSNKFYLGALMTLNPKLKAMAPRGIAVGLGGNWQAFFDPQGGLYSVDDKGEKIVLEQWSLSIQTQEVLAHDRVFNLVNKKDSVEQGGV